jgi:hypothetical protein
LDETDPTNFFHYLLFLQESPAATFKDKLAIASALVSLKTDDRGSREFLGPIFLQIPGAKEHGL